MKGLVHILYRIGCRKRRKRGLKLGEPLKDIMIGPPVGGTQGNPRDDVTVRTHRGRIDSDRKRNDEHQVASAL